MISITQFTTLVLRPTLKEIPNGYSRTAEKLLLVIAAHESRGGYYLAQTRGPARGIFQIEPLTHDTTWVHGDTCYKNGQLLNIQPDLNRLYYDLRYQVFIARQRIFMIPAAIPKDLDGICEYAKKYWNSELGRATAAKYKQDYFRWRSNQL